jgi:predicted nucleic acid-binding protein
MRDTTVLFDACVLYPAPLRSLLMWLSEAELFRPRWTDAIHEEWMRSVQRTLPDFNREQAERVRDLMNAHVPGCLVTGYQHRISGIVLPDPDDRHVLAAAIHAQASMLVTFNLRDFPESAVRPHGIVAIHPDVFVSHWLLADPDSVCRAVHSHRASLKNPPKSVDEFLEILECQGLSSTVARLRHFADRL